MLEGLGRNTLISEFAVLYKGPIILVTYDNRRALSSYFNPDPNGFVHFRNQDKPPKHFLRNQCILDPVVHYTRMYGFFYVEWIF